MGHTRPLKSSLNGTREHDGNSLARCSESWGQPPSLPAPATEKLPTGGARKGLLGGRHSQQGTHLWVFQSSFLKNNWLPRANLHWSYKPQGEEFKGDPTRLLSHSVSTRGILAPGKVPSANSCVHAQMRPPSWKTRSSEMDRNSSTRRCLSNTSSTWGRSGRGDGPRASQDTSGFLTLSPLKNNEPEVRRPYVTQSARQAAPLGAVSVYFIYNQGIYEGIQNLQDILRSPRISLSTNRLSSLNYAVSQAHDLLHVISLQRPDWGTGSRQRHFCFFWNYNSLTPICQRWTQFPGSLFSHPKKEISCTRANLSDKNLSNVSKTNGDFFCSKSSYLRMTEISHTDDHTSCRIQLLTS